MGDARPAAAHRRSDDTLGKAFDELEREAPDSLARAIGWMRKPQARIVRLPLGILCIVGSFLWFLPVLGLWFLPLGLLLIAQDVRFLRRPVGRMTLYLLDRWKRLRRWWARKKEARAKRLRSESR
jgi:hypothetical protein